MSDVGTDDKFKKRFADISDEQRKIIISNKDAVNPKRSTAQAIKLLRDYLLEKGLSVQFEDFPPDSVLGKFYVEARNKNGELYKKSSMQTIRHGISRFLSDKLDIDILRDVRFKQSNVVFKAMGKELKRQGLWGVNHYPPIDDIDLKKAYFSFDLFSGKSLQQKVFIDIMLYFGRRGRENLRELKITDFALTTDANELRYVYLKKDELAKNHQHEANTADGHMYEIKGKN